MNPTPLQRTHRPYYLVQPLRALPHAIKTCFFLALTPLDCRDAIHIHIYTIPDAATPSTRVQPITSVVPTHAPLHPQNTFTFSRSSTSYLTCISLSASFSNQTCPARLRRSVFMLSPNQCQPAHTPNSLLLIRSYRAENALHRTSASKKRVQHPFLVPNTSHFSLSQFFVTDDITDTIPLWLNAV